MDLMEKFNNATGLSGYSRDDFFGKKQTLTQMAGKGRLQKCDLCCWLGHSSSVTG